MTNWKKNVVLFLGSQTLSLFGSSLVQYAMMWHITLTTQSGVMMMIYILCGFIPTFLLSPFAGVWADRYNRKLLIVTADAMIAIATLVIALLLMAGFASLPLFFIMAAIRALGTGIQTPAVGAVLPQIVPTDKLTKANGINGSLQAMIMFLSPMASAALLATTDLANIFLIDVFTAAAAIVVLLGFLRIPMHEKAAERQNGGYFTDLKQGIAYIKEHVFLQKLFLFFAVFFVLMAPASFLTPLQVTRTFGDDVWRLSAIEITFSVGMMAGGAVIAAWGGFRNKVHTMTFSALVMAACTLALGLIPNFWLYLLFMTVFGVAVPIFNTPTTVLLQEKVEENYMGRVFGLFSMISTSMMPIGMLVFGPIADLVRIEWLLIATGLLMVLLSVFLVRERSLLEAGKPAEA